MEFLERTAVTELDPWFQEHIARYHKLLEYKLGSYVLDIACGSGYGTKFISESGSKVLGVDQSSSTIMDNIRKFSNNSNLAFQSGDAEKLTFAQNSFSSVVSFETIEHLTNPEEFLKGVRDILQSDGLFFVSTPNALITKPINGIPSNPYHVKEYTPDELLLLLSSFFRVLEVYGQIVSKDFKVNYYWNPEPFRRFKPKYYLWAMLNRISRYAPITAHRISKRIFKSSLYPEAEQWVFSDTDLSSAHDLFVVCQKI